MKMASVYGAGHSPMKKAADIRTSGSERIFSDMETTLRVDPAHRMQKKLSPLDSKIRALEHAVTCLLPQVQGITGRVLKGEKCNALAVATLGRRLTEMGKLGAGLRTRVPRRIRASSTAVPAPA